MGFRATLGSKRPRRLDVQGFDTVDEALPALSVAEIENAIVCIDGEPQNP